MLLPLLICLASIAVIPIADGNVVRQSRAEKACGTKKCKSHALKLLESIDPTLDPCDDFYAYACGSWALHNPIPDDIIYWSLFTQMRRMTNRRLRDVISKPEDPNSPAAVIKVQRFYQSCMDTERIEAQGIEPLANILNRRGGWPMAMTKESWNCNKTPWFLVDGSYFKMTGHQAIANVKYSPDDEDSSKLVITINHERTFPFDDMYKKLDSPTIRTKYLEIIEEAATIFAAANGHNSLEDISQDASNLLDLEQSLQLIRLKDNGSNRTKMSICEFQNMYNNFENKSQVNQIDWLKMIRRVFKNVNDITITSNTPIYISCQLCFSEMAKLFANTDTRTLVNYIHWVFLSNHMQYANEKLRDIRHRMIFANYENVTRAPRWEDCIEDLPLKDGMSIMFSREYVQTAAIRKAVDMTNRIRDKYIKDVERVEWANDDEKQYIIDKVEKLREQIGYPEWYSNETAIQKLYENFKVGKNYLKNIIHYTRYKTERQLQFLTTGLPKHEWFDYPITVNAFYDGPSNTMIIPAAVIQEPVFVEDMPNAIQYGFIGFAVGHEVSHALDVNGIRYNKDGNRLQDGIQKLLDHYDTRAQCFVHQYSQYTLEGLDKDGNPTYLDGNVTQGENIADTMGVRVAYDVFKDKQECDTATPDTLEDLPNVNADQLFFLSFATGWCYAERQGIAGNLNMGQHSPQNIRTNGALANLEAFAEAFQCPVGSKMNPENKCSLWN